MSASNDLRSLLLLIAAALIAGFKLPWIFWAWVILEALTIGIDRLDEWFKSRQKETNNEP